MSYAAWSEAEVIATFLWAAGTGMLLVLLGVAITLLVSWLRD